MIYSKWFKGILDKVISLLMLLILLPLLLVCTLVLFFANKGKVFFVQQRPGLNNKIFHLIKFKTMNDRKDDSGKLLPDKDRITPAGRIIRSTSLDELPQLINVLKGDMSLVGPRPLLVRYLDRYTPQQARRHEVKPGITGWAQINGRNAISWEQKFELDVWYADNLSFLLDARILFRTLLKVFRREDVNSTKAATMPEFMGTSTGK